MSTSYINKINYVTSFCIDKAFNRNLIHKSRDVSKAGDYDVVFTLRNDSITLAYQGEGIRPEIFNHRVINTFKLFEWATKHLDSPINCTFIFSPEDNIESGDSGDPSFSKLGFSARPHSYHLPIPDPHFVSHVFNKTLDKLPFNEKKSIAIFRGTDTCRQRVRISQQSLNVPYIDCGISSFLPRKNGELFFKGIDKSLIKAPRMSLDEQFEYKYILDMYGHAVSWDRPCWVIPSNSILLSIDPDPKDSIKSNLWYSEFLDAHNIVPKVTEKKLLNNFDLHSIDDYNPVQKDWAPFYNSIYNN